MKKTIQDAKINLKNIDAFATTTGPGLLGGLLIGSNYAKTLSLANHKPFISVNHLQGHILITRMKKKNKFSIFIASFVWRTHTTTYCKEI